MSKTSKPDGLSRRERQIMDIVYARGRATAAEIHEALPDPPSYSATRATLRTLEEKGQVRHVEEGPRYVFLPMLSPDKAKQTALRHLVATFFQGSPGKVLAALLEEPDLQLSQAERERLAELIRNAKKEGR